jgi:outer membrane biosynthesis protein TonB
LKKLLRIFTVSTLAFAWLLIAPTEANSDDPIAIGAQRIQALNEKVSDLTDSAELVSLIDVAQDKYEAAVNARDSKISAEEAYDEAVETEANALSTLDEKILNVSTAQSAVDGQTATVEIALNEKNSAQEALNIANINLQTAQSNMQSAGGQGLAYTVYHLTRTWPSIATPSGVICSGTWNSNSMQLPVCGNRYENFIVKFTGQITVPDHWTTTYFAGSTDDGFRMFVNGQLAINNWVEQGVRWSPFSPVYDVSEDKTLDVEIWWYNGGGPGSYHLGWAIPGGWTGAGCDYTGGWGVDFSCNLGTFSSGQGATQEQINYYNQALAARTSALAVYNDKLSVYNQEVATLNELQDDLEQAQEEKDSAETTYEIAELNTALTLAAKDLAIENYNNAIEDMNDAITAAEEEYEAQWDFEEKQRINAAIATALANQPQPTPTPEVTVEPTPEPSPEPSTEPTEEPTEEPTPEPSPEPTDEPTDEPKPEPTDEPTPDPEPTDEPVVDPTEEPTPEPTEEPTPEPEPTTNPEIEDEELAALIPEKGTGTSEDLSGVIANLTSKDNKLVTLSAEQVAAVSQTLKSLTQEAKAEIAGDLGIKASEVAQIAEQMKDNPALASAFVEFAERAGDAGDSAMPFTLADAVTEVQTEAFLADPLGAITNIDFEKVLNPAEWGKDMTDDQREKVQEVIIPVIIVSNIVSSVMSIRRL